MNTILTRYESPVIQDPVPQVAATRAGALEVYKLLPERHWGSVCIGVNQKCGRGSAYQPHWPLGRIADSL